MKTQTLKKIIQVIVAILTAVAGALTANAMI